MNKTSLVILFLLLTVAVSLFAPAVSLAVSPTQMLSEADQLVREARQTKSDTERDAKYEEAVDAYEHIIKKYPDTVESAQAKFNLARVYETAKSTYARQGDKRSGKYQNEPGAILLYGELVKDYNKPLSELKRLYTPEEAAVLKKIADEAEVRRRALIDKIDRQNSGKWQYKLMDWLVNLTGRRSGFSYWFALVLITIFVKILITPLTKAQFKSMKEMQKIQPLMKELQQKYKNDPKTLQTKMMELYKEHGVNPFASCLPLLIQMPILIYLYGIINLYQYQFEKGGFLWIGSSLSHLFSVPVPFQPGKLLYVTAANLAEPDLLLVVLYLISMFISQKISIVDPTQAEQQKMMSIMFPLMFGFLFAGFPSAFLLYWLVFNIFQTTQQYLIIRSGRHEVPAAATAPASGPAPRVSSEAERVSERISRQRSRSRRRRR